jgi:hypothetical protein
MDVLNVNFPEYCLFFIKKIQEELDKDDIDFTEPHRFEIDSPYGYFSKAFDLVIKTFEKKGFVVNTPSFKIQLKNGVKTYLYRWRIQKLSYDDLPF